MYMFKEKEERDVNNRMNCLIFTQYLHSVVQAYASHHFT